MGQTYSQMFPPASTLTEKNLDSQVGKVVIVTGGYSGVGYYLSSVLYDTGAHVYIAGRSESSARSAIESITASSASPTTGQLTYLPLDLSDLSTIPKTVSAFLSTATRLDVLFNNAGVSLPPAGSTTAQGHELQMGTNCLGHFLLTMLLLPLLQKTATRSPAASVRVVWTSSQVVDLSAPKGGIDLRDLETPPTDQTRNYTNSKTGNWFLAAEFDRRYGREAGILSVTQNPGNLKTNLLREHWVMKLMVSPLLHHARFGAYTELCAGFSAELGMEDGGSYVVPWGRRHPGPREDLLACLKGKEDGGEGIAEEFWEWCVGRCRAWLPDYDGEVNA